jgi:Fe-S-cluster containining protein
MALPPHSTSASIELPGDASQLVVPSGSRVAEPGPWRAVHFASAKSEVSPAVKEQPWYRQGLRFECSQCGKCCGGGPGTIRVSDDEIAALADRLGLSDAEFRPRYTYRLRNGDVSLVEKENYDCIFFDRKRGCTVYHDRPKQCRSWPFWSSVVFSIETWDDEASECPGMNSGPLHDVAKILRIADNDGTSGHQNRSAPR